MNLRYIDSPKIPTANRLLRRFLLPTLSVLFVGGAFLAAASANAQDVSQPAVLSLDQAVQLTLEKHPQLGVFLHRREAYQGLAEQVGVSERPNISLSVEDFAGSGDQNGFDSAQSTLAISWVSQGARINSRVQSARVAASQIERASCRERV